MAAVVVGAQPTGTRALGLFDFATLTFATLALYGLYACASQLLANRPRLSPSGRWMSAAAAPRVIAPWARSGVGRKRGGTPMNEALVVSNLVLWVVVLALLVAVFALARQVGILHERVAPMGALMMDNGPKVGAASPVFTLTDLAGRPVNIGAPSLSSTLLFFLSPTCPVCKKLLPIVKSTAASSGAGLHRARATATGRATQVHPRRAQAFPTCCRPPRRHLT
jgi:hypothetical protein